MAHVIKTTFADLTTSLVSARELCSLGDFTRGAVTHSGVNQL
jgi:hypothetical protein